MRFFNLDYSVMKYYKKYKYFILVSLFCGTISMVFLIVWSLWKEMWFDRSFLWFVHLSVGIGAIALMRYIYFDKEKKKWWQIDGRYFAIISLVLLVHIPFYLAVGEKSIAEERSIYSYYALVVMLVLVIVRWNNNSRK